MKMLPKESVRDLHLNMLSNLPGYVVPVFLACVLFTCGFIVYWLKASKIKQTKLVAGGFLLVIWMAGISVLAYNEFFLHFELPPRFALILMVPLITIFILLWKARPALERLSTQSLTWVHVVRVPIEMVLFWLFLAAVVPIHMTFEGRNFDIISGATAPLVALFLMSAKRKKLLLLWNVLALALVLAVVIHAILAIPTPIQQIAFDQPNVGVMYFPFVLLPGVVVPTVIFSHLLMILRLMKSRP
jgi:hypothetical protein